MTIRRGICPACDREYVVTKAGVMRDHWAPADQREREQWQCPGVGQPPKPDAPATETRIEYTVEVDMGNGNGFQPCLRVPYIDTDERQVRESMRGIVKPKRLMCRTVTIGPWRPVDTEEEP